VINYINNQAEHLKRRSFKEEFIEISSTNPAKIFGRSYQKGQIEEGMNADLVIWDPGAKETISAKIHHQNCDLNIYEGFDIIGIPFITIVSGEIKWNADKVR